VKLCLKLARVFVDLMDYGRQFPTVDWQQKRHETKTHKIYTDKHK